MALLNFLSLSLVFVFSQTTLQQSDFRTGEFVIYTSPEGVERYIAVGNVNVNGPMYVSRREHNGAGWTQGSIRVTPDQLIKPVPSIPHRMQQRDQSLRKGMIVLGADKKMFIIEDVFADGRVAVSRLTINANSRHRIPNTDFVKQDREGYSIINKNEIIAVETNCFLRYCRGQVYSEIENIPVCQRDVLTTHNNSMTPEMRAALNPGFTCGRFGKFEIHALFSDGSIAIHNRIINPFPRSLHNYQLNPPVPSEGEALTEAEN